MTTKERSVLDWRQIDRATIGAGGVRRPPGAPSYPALPEKDRLAFEWSMRGDEPYVLGPDSKTRPGVPAGTVLHARLDDCRAFPGAGRDLWVYVPARYDAAKPAALMVFQDGGRYLGPEIDVATVFDNLIDGGTMPVTIGLFVDPGDKGPGNPIWGGTNNRSFEYDSLGGAYASLIVDELLPELRRRWVISDDPEARAICGHSSGGICAFNVAWERPDQFLRVVSHCGSYVNIRGGHVFPWLVRSTPAKPIRVFLQTGLRDLDIVFGDWLNANRAMDSALTYAGYDHRFVIGAGGHTFLHGGAIFPETMRWLWHDKREVGR
jgi:enterochelin esterase-like enzyme